MKFVNWLLRKFGYELVRRPKLVPMDCTGIDWCRYCDMTLDLCDCPLVPSSERDTEVVF